MLREPKTRTNWQRRRCFCSVALRGEGWPEVRSSSAHDTYRYVISRCWPQIFRNCSPLHSHELRCDRPCQTLLPAPGTPCSSNIAASPVGIISFDDTGKAYAPVNDDGAGDANNIQDSSANPYHRIWRCFRRNANLEKRERDVRRNDEHEFGSRTHRQRVNVQPSWDAQRSPRGLIRGGAYAISLNETPLARCPRSAKQTYSQVSVEMAVTTLEEYIHRNESWRSTDYWMEGCIEQFVPWHCHCCCHRCKRTTRRSSVAVCVGLVLLCGRGNSTTT